MHRNDVERKKSTTKTRNCYAVDTGEHRFVLFCPSCLVGCAMQIKELATRYSEFISFPIEVWAEKTSYDQVPDADAEVAEGEEPKMKTVTRTSMQWEVCKRWKKTKKETL